MVHIHNLKSLIPQQLLQKIEEVVSRGSFTQKVNYGVGENTFCEKLILDPALFVQGSLEQQTFNEIYEFLLELVHKHIMPVTYKLRCPSFEPIELRRMLGATRAHSDGIGPQSTSAGISYRIATIILTLSESSDAIVFPNYNTTIALNRGDVLFFPPYWTHEHFTVSNSPGRIALQTHLRETAPANDRPEMRLLPLG